MIHLSNPECNLCGVRHTSGHDVECKGILYDLWRCEQARVEHLQRKLVAANEKLRQQPIPCSPAPGPYPGGIEGSREASFGRYPEGHAT